MPVEFRLNKQDVSTDVDPKTPLLEVLRNDFELNAPKFGCGLAQCGACAVHVDDVSTRACVLPVGAVAGKSVTTLEGLGNAANPHPLQEAFIAEQALQCGYCGSGIIMAAAALLERNPKPSDADVRKALSGHLCRCGAQPRMLKAVSRAVAKSRDPR